MVTVYISPAHEKVEGMLMLLTWRMLLRKQLLNDTLEHMQSYIITLRCRMSPGVLLSVCSASDSGCQLHMPHPLTWRALEQLNYMLVCFHHSSASPSFDTHPTKQVAVGLQQGRIAVALPCCLHLDAHMYRCHLCT